MPISLINNVSLVPWLVSNNLVGICSSPETLTEWLDCKRCWSNIVSVRFVLTIQLLIHIHVYHYPITCMTHDHEQNCPSFLCLEDWITGSNAKVWWDAWCMCRLHGQDGWLCSASLELTPNISAGFPSLCNSPFADRDNTPRFGSHSHFDLWLMSMEVEEVLRAQPCIRAMLLSFLLMHVYHAAPGKKPYLGSNIFITQVVYVS